MCLTADGNDVLCKSYTGDKSQQWIRAATNPDEVTHVHQAIIEDNNEEIKDLKNQQQDDSDDSTLLLSLIRMLVQS